VFFYDVDSNSYFVECNFPTDFGTVRDRVAIVPTKDEVKFLFNSGMLVMAHGTLGLSEDKKRE
jgi:hypothetical protein